MPIADLVLRNAKVITLDPDRPTARLVAIKDGRVIFAGSDDELETFRGRGTRIVDCAGKTLLPGFNDAHCHIFSFIRNQITIALGPPAVSSIEDIKTAVRLRAQETPPGRWISGADYSDFYLAEKRHPNRWDLDEAAPDHPVILSHRSLHACVLNSRALALAGINAETPEPPGASIDRDPSTGEPTGVLYEMLGYMRYRVMPPLSGDELERGVARANRIFVSLGITSLQDATVTNEVKRWEIYRRFKDEGLLKSRIYLMTGVDQVKRFREAGLAFRTGDDHLRMGGLKIVPGEATGVLHPSQPDLNRYVLEANAEGCQVAIHAVQPTTVEAAVIAYEQVPRRSDIKKHRHRIEHCAECPPELFERVERLGVTIVTQPPFLHYSGERYLAQIPPEQVRWLFRIRSLMEAGLTVAGSSDTPVVPNNPMVGIYAAVTRRAATGQVLAPEERISVRQALTLYTTNAAYASFDEGQKGSITPGKLADVVLLSDDPTEVETEAIKDIKVEMTIIGGEIVWERG